MSDKEKREVEMTETAVKAAAQGRVSEVLEACRNEALSADNREHHMEALIPEAVRNAAKDGLLTEAIGVIGAEDVPEDVQTKAIDAIAKNNGSWLGGLVGKREMSEAAQMKIIDVLAEGGWASEILDIIGAGNIPDTVDEKAKHALAKAIIVAGEYRVKDMTTEEKIEALGILSRMVESRNPLQKEGVMSKGTVKKPASAAKDAKTAKLTNKS